MPYFKMVKNGIYLYFVNKHLSSWALFFQRPGSILEQIGIPHIGDHRVRATCYFTVLNAVVLIQISILIFVAINRPC